MDPTHVIILTIGVCVCDGGVFTYLCCGWGFLHMSFLSTQNSSHSHYNGWKEISKDMENLPFKESGVFLWCIATGLPPFLKHEEHGFFLLWRCDRFLPKIFLPRFMDATFPKLDIKTHWTPPWFFKDLNQKSEENSFGMEPILWVQLLKCPVFSSPAASKKKKRHENFARGFPREDLRSSLVPAARGWTLSDLMKEVDDYGEATGNKVRWMATKGGIG